MAGDGSDAVSVASTAIDLSSDGEDLVLPVRDPAVRVTDEDGSSRRQTGAALDFETELVLARLGFIGVRPIGAPRVAATSANASGVVAASSASASGVLATSSASASSAVAASSASASGASAISPATASGSRAASAPTDAWLPPLRPAANQPLARSRSRSPIEIRARPLPLAEPEEEPAPAQRSAAPISLLRESHNPIWRLHGSGVQAARFTRHWSAETNGAVRAAFPPSGCDAFEHARRYIRNIIDMYKWSLYIGVTENPVRRWAHHADRFDTLTVLMEAPSSAITGRVEVALIREFRNHVGCLNGSGGGESLTRGSPHYLYVCTRSDSLIRVPIRRR